jgi:hypothetical protein
MKSENDILTRKIKIIAVRVPQVAGQSGTLELAGGWKCGISKTKSDQLKPYEGREMEIGEIIRLSFSE